MDVPLIDLKAQYRTIQQDIKQAIETVVESQKFILGAEVAALESEIAQLTRNRFAIACASGTDALLLSLLALGIQPEDEVITTSYSFFSTAGMIAWLKARPVFVDVDPRTFNLDVEQVAASRTPRTKAVIAVHLFGQCSRIEALADLGVPVIEDAAQAIGSFRNGKPAGSFGAAGCFSFFPTKNLGGYGDGGMITTNDDEIAMRLRELRAHGEGQQRYAHRRIGTNSRLDELQAAVLRVKLKHLTHWNEKRNRHATFYRQVLNDLPLELPQIDPQSTTNYHQFVIKTERRDSLRSFLADRGIGSAIYYPIPLPFQPCFSYLGYQTGRFPHAEKCAATSLAIPIYPELTQQQLEYVTSTIRNFFE